MSRKYKTEEGKYSHDFCLKQLDAAQQADHDNRERAREDLLFLASANGQWDPDSAPGNTDKPKYTFDLTTPIIKQITGEIKQSDFAIEVEPLGGEASEDDAKTYNGLVRNIEQISKAQTRAYHPALQSAVTAGIGGWRVKQGYVDGDSFDQDLIIEGISNFHDRVWFDANSELQDASDAEMAWVMHAFTPEAYKKKWPKHEPASMEDTLNQYTYWYKKEVVIVGEFYYLRDKERELVLLSNGAVMEAEKWDKVKDEYQDQGLPVVEKKRRKRKTKVCYVRQFDRDGWLDEEKETVFSMIPVVPEYANFQILDNKVIYFGAVRNMKDPQQVLNYSLSRQIEEVALAPREKLVMTREQAKGHEAQLKTLNTSTDPVLFYNHVEELPPPFKIGGPQLNAGIQIVNDSMNAIINQVSGKFAANMGDNPNAQSGVAIENLQDKGDNHDWDYTESHEIALCQTFNILVDAIPKVYGPQRQARLLNEDGSSEFVTLNEEVFDRQTGQNVVVNDLSKGTYSVSCKAGPAFKNRQDKTVQSMLDVAQYLPEVITMGSDVFLGNINAPGMDTVAERARRKLFEAGQIPTDQLTEDEKKELMQAQQQAAQDGDQPTPEMLIGQAEMMNAQTEQQKTVGEQQIKAANTQLAMRKQQLEEAKFKSQQQEQRISQILEVQMQQAEYVKELAETMKIIREAMGAQVQVVSDGSMQAFDNQTQKVISSQ